jgi:hypothetical protein
VAEQSVASAAMPADDQAQDEAPDGDSSDSDEYTAAPRTGAGLVASPPDDSN